MNKILNKKTIALLVVIIVAAVSFKILNGTDTQSVAYQKVPVSRGDIQVTIAATGEVGPRTRLELKPPVAGRIESLLVKEGDEVKEGSIIGYLSSTERVALIDTARAKGMKELNEWKELYKAIPLISPIDGMVILKSMEPGQTVGTTDSIITLSDKLIVQVQVDETDIAKVEKGQEVNIELDAYPNSTIKGITEQIAFDATVSENVRVYEVNILPQDPPAYMKSGMGVEAIFNTEKKTDVLIIPRTTLQYDSQGAYVYKESRKKKMRKVYLDLGVQVQDKVEVIAGINEEDNFFYPSIEFKGNRQQKSVNPLISKPPRRGKKK